MSGVSDKPSAQDTSPWCGGVVQKSWAVCRFVGASREVLLWFALGGMDGEWLQRLCDHTGPLGSCFLQEYARSLRLLSGLSRVGYLRALASVRHQRISSAARAAILNHRAVRELTAFLRSFQEQEMPVVCEVLTQELFPDAPERGLFLR